MKNRIQEVLTKKELSHAEVASKIGVTRQAVQKWAAGADLSISNLMKLSEFLGVSVSYLCGQEESSDKYRVTSMDAPPLSGWYRVPVLSVEGSCGYGAENSQVDIVAAVDFNLEFLNNLPGVTNKKALHIINSHGDSMSPTVLDRSFVVINSEINTFVSDGIYGFINDEHLFIKRIQRNVSGGVTVISDNPAYDREVITKENLKNIKVVGKVVFIFNGVIV